MKKSIVIYCEYVNPTNKSGSKMKIYTYDFGPFGDGKAKIIKTVSYNREFSQGFDQIEKLLTDSGLEPRSSSTSQHNIDLFITDWTPDKFHLMGKLFNIVTGDERYLIKDANPIGVK